MGIPQTDTIRSGSLIGWAFGGQNHISTGVVKQNLPVVDAEDGQLWDVQKYERQELTKSLAFDGVLIGNIWRDGISRNSFLTTYAAGSLTVAPGRAIVGGKRVDLGLGVSYDAGLSVATPVPSGGNEKIIYLDVYERKYTPPPAFAPGGVGMDLSIYADFSTYNVSTSTLKEYSVAIGGSLPAPGAGHFFLEIGRLQNSGSVTDTRVSVAIFLKQTPNSGDYTALTIAANAVQLTQWAHTFAAGGTINTINSSPTMKAGSIVYFKGTTGQTVQFTAGSSIVPKNNANAYLKYNFDVIAFQLGTDGIYREIYRSMTQNKHAYTMTTTPVTIGEDIANGYDAVVVASSLSGAVSLTLPDATGYNTGRKIDIKLLASAATLTINTTGGQLINDNGSTSMQLTKQNDFVTLLSDGSNWNVIGSSLPTQTYPTGMFAPFGGTVAPLGFLFCNGTAVSRTTYAALFGVIGTNYGVGDGSSTFNLPNMQNVYPRGVNGLTPSVNTNAGVTGAGTAQAVAMLTNPITAGFCTGKYALVSDGASTESVLITAVSSTTITGIFVNNHSSGVNVSQAPDVPGLSLTAISDIETAHEHGYPTHQEGSGSNTNGWKVDSQVTTSNTGHKHLILQPANVGVNWAIHI